MNKHGVNGEQKAKEYLIANKYKILCCNYKTHLGEIDIIAKQKDVIVFVEVKARMNTNFGLPRESVTTYKQNKIKQVAMQFLQKNNLLNSKVRFDIVEVLVDQVTHIANAF